MTGPCAVSQAVREGRVTQEGTPPHEPKLCRTKPTHVCLHRGSVTITVFVFHVSAIDYIVCTVLRRCKD